MAYGYRVKDRVSIRKVELAARLDSYEDLKKCTEHSVLTRS